LNERLEDIDPETRLEIESSVEEYEIKLRRELTELEEMGSIVRKAKRFRERLIRAELDDVTRDETALREEEQKLINWNLYLSLGISVVVIGLALIFTESVQTFSEAASTYITNNLNWFYVLLSSGFLVYLVYLAFSQYGHVVLGAPNDRPEFSDFSWYSMLFSAGMGVGILFWGAAEPVSHYIHPPVADPETVLAAKEAMALSAFHWGLHAWGIYTVCAVGVAYYGFRKQKKYLISSSIMDVIPNRRLRRVLKLLVDMVSTLAIVFGVAASLGMGLIQIASGLEHVFGIHASGAFGYLGIVVVMTALYIVSSSTGLQKGIRLLSNLNMVVALLLMVFIFVVGPKLFILKLSVDSIGQYIQRLPELSFKVDPFQPGYEGWMKDWTVTYFTWWIAWAPFVGIFIARISKGRTIRELILGSLIGPTLFCIVWFSVFGGTALHLEVFEGNGISQLVDEDVSVALFGLLDRLPLSQVTSVVAIVLLFTFLITSADSATFVIAMMTSEGDLEPSQKLKLVWGVLLAALCYLLVIGGGIKALQAAALVCAFPFAVVLLLIIASVTFRLSIQIKKKRV
jgi:glycine betaine transporter